MSDGGKGAAVGLTAAIGLGGMSMADDVVRAGMRGVSAMGDDVARVGARGVGSMGDDALAGLSSTEALEAAGMTFDDAGRLVVEAPKFDPSRHYAPQAKPTLPGAAGASGKVRPRFVHGHAGDEGVNWAAELGEGGLDLALEFVEFDPELELSPPEHIVERLDPRFLDLRDGLRSWEEALVDNQGRAPLVLVVEHEASDQDLVRIEGRARSLSELGSQCWQRGSACVFVVCAADQGEACAQTSVQQFGKTVREDHGSIGQFMAMFSYARMDRNPRPAYIAAAGGGPERSIERLSAPSPGPGDGLTLDPKDFGVEQPERPVYMPPPGPVVEITSGPEGPADSK